MSGLVNDINSYEYYYNKTICMAHYVTTGYFLVDVVNFYVIIFIVQGVPP